MKGAKNINLQISYPPIQFIQEMSIGFLNFKWLNLGI